MGHTNTLDDREGGAGLLRVAVKYRNREDGIYRTPDSGKYRTVTTVSTKLALGNTYCLNYILLIIFSLKGPGHSYPLPTSTPILARGIC